ncbi:MAG: hypothetical protein MNPFHGCM_00152 [Gemmatimonadaceae bacterium]|nr:hypothetical protein [Gemmatimonadaceae bacterium]
MGMTPILAAALTGVPVGIQKQGIWCGFRQLFVRFAGAAETAQMYTADALAREMNRALGRTPIHSICISGRDALGSTEFLVAALKQVLPGQRVMADTDGQRPEAIAALQDFIDLVQITVELPYSAVSTERMQETVRAANRAGCGHAVVISGTDEASDADYLRIVELAHDASTATAIVIHPGPAEERSPLDRRWSVLLEHAMAKHTDVRVALRLGGPATIR